MTVAAVAIVDGRVGTFAVVFLVRHGCLLFGLLVLLVTPIG